MKDISVLLLFIYIFHKSRAGFIPTFFDDDDDYDDDDLLNFTSLVEENKKYGRHQDICPLRIFGGVNANITQVPYQVGLRTVDGKHHLFWSTFCGGSLITLRFVVSAAHCFFADGEPIPLSIIRVYAGTVRANSSVNAKKDAQWRSIKKFYKHAHYDDETLVNDLSILELQSEFIESNKIRPIRLHSLEMDREVEGNEQCVASGFGRVGNVCGEITMHFTFN